MILYNLVGVFQHFGGFCLIIAFLLSVLGDALSVS